MTLATANSFSGATAISQGVLQLANSNALQGSTVSVNANSGLKFSPGVGTFNLGGLAGSGSLALSDTSGGNVALDVGGNSSTTTFSGTIGGAGSLAKYGTGMLTLSGTNGYSGGTSIYAGIVQAGNNSALGSSAAPLAVNGGTFDVHGFNVSIGASAAMALSIASPAPART